MKIASQNNLQDIKNLEYRTFNNGTVIAWTSYMSPKKPYMDVTREYTIYTNNPNLYADEVKVFAVLNIHQPQNAFAFGGDEIIFTLPAGINETQDCLLDGEKITCRKYYYAVKTPYID